MWPVLKKTKDSCTIGALTITRDSRVVTLEGQPVRLSPKEHELILVLAENGRFMHQDQILSGMSYKKSEMPEPKIVDVFVCKIRRKFENITPLGGDYIESVPGSGYRVLNAPATFAALSI